MSVVAAGIEDRLVPGGRFFQFHCGGGRERGGGFRMKDKVRVSGARVTNWFLYVRYYSRLMVL